MVVFYNIIDILALNTYLIYEELNPSYRLLRKQPKGKIFLENVDFLWPSRTWLSGASIQKLQHLLYYKELKIMWLFILLWVEIYPRVFFRLFFLDHMRVKKDFSVNIDGGYLFMIVTVIFYYWERVVSITNVLKNISLFWKACSILCWKWWSFCWKY